jgi:MFS family permease
VRKNKGLFDRVAVDGQYLVCLPHLKNKMEDTNQEFGEECEFSLSPPEEQKLFRYQDPQYLPLIILLLFVVFLSQATVGIPMGFLPQLVTSPKHQYKLTNSQLGLMISMHSLALAIGSPLSMFLSSFKQVGNFGVLLTGMVLLTLGAFGFAFCTNFFHFMAVKITIGLANAFINVSVMAVFIVNTENIVDLISLENFVNGLAFVLTCFGGSWIYVSFGYYWTFMSIGTTLAVCTVFTFICFAFNYQSKWSDFDRRKEPCLSLDLESSPNTLTFSKMFEMCWNQEFIASILCCFQTFVVLGAIGVIAGSHYEKSLGVTAESVGLLFSASFLLFSGASFLVGPAAVKVGFKTCLIFGSFSLGFCLILFGPAPYLDKFVSSKLASWLMIIFAIFFYGLGVAFGTVPFIP